MQKSYIKKKRKLVLETATPQRSRTYENESNANITPSQWSLTRSKVKQSIMQLNYLKSHAAAAIGSIL